MNMPRLWMLADTDMVTQSYRLVDTGQGYQRLQSCPQISEAMHSILGRIKQAHGPWVGLSVVHLGDRDVPNALMFIDKYTQVPRILAPIVLCIERLPTLVTDQVNIHTHTHTHTHTLTHTYTHDRYTPLKNTHTHTKSHAHKQNINTHTTHTHTHTHRHSTSTSRRSGAA